MATLKKIDDSKVHIYNPFGLVVTPFKDENTEGDYAYLLKEVIRDTTTIAQDDPTETAVDNEFSAAPIINNTTVGAFTFSAEVADMQDQLVEALCGYKKGASGKLYAPSTYVPKYAKVDLVFLAGKDESGKDKYIAAVLPKLQMNSKATFDSLSSSMGRITLAGTGLNLSMTDGQETVESPFYIEPNYTLPKEEE
jgi:hypothetical protein